MDAFMKAKGCTILHIDDDPDDQQLLRNALSSVDEHSQIIEAIDGAEGIAFLMQMKEQNALPCLIVLDINMPKVSGREACIAIKKDEVLATIPMIIFSTSSSSMDKLFFEGRGVTYITKPTDFSHIVDVASRILEHCDCE
jgi:CheY-like chemotaxis protein